MAAMTTLRADIDYKFESAPAGGRVIITARSAAAIEAVHAFLRYQIAEHHTGDPSDRSTLNLLHRPFAHRMRG